MLITCKMRVMLSRPWRIHCVGQHRDSAIDNAQRTLILLFFFFGGSQDYDPFIATLALRRLRQRPFYCDRLRRSLPLPSYDDRYYCPVTEIFTTRVRQPLLHHFHVFQVFKVSRR